MVSKSQIKLIRSLQQKKFREKTGLFVAEGPKIIADLIESGIEIHSLFSTEISTQKENLYSITPDELQKISYLKTANTSLALFRIPSFSSGQEMSILHMELLGNWFETVWERFRNLFGTVWELFETCVTTFV